MNHSIQPIHSCLSTNTESDGFQRLWNKIEKHEIRNQKAEKKVNDLYQEYEQIIFPYEKNITNSRYRFVEHLMTFLSVKAMKPKEHQRLFNYLDYWMNALHNFYAYRDLDTLNRLSEQLELHHDKLFHKEKQQALNRACNEIEVMLKGILGEDIDLPHKKIRDAITSGDSYDFMTLIESIKAEYLDNNPEEQDEWDDVSQEWQDFEFNYYQNEEDEASKITELFKGSRLNKMYKRIANVIHPDKEQDPLKREEKNKLMQSLVKAKKDRDVITLIKLYSQFVPDGEYYLGEEAMKHVEHLLEMKIRTLNMTHKDIFNGQGLKSYVWKNFSATSKKKTREKMQDHIHHIELEIKNTEKDILKLDSVKRVVKFIKFQRLELMY